MSDIKPLVSKLANANNSKEKLKIILELGELKEEKALRTLFQLLSTEDDNKIKSHVADAIIKIGGSKAVDFSIKLLRDASWVTRMKAAEILGELKDKKATNALIRTLKTDKEASVREWTVIGLGEIGDKKAVRVIIQTMMTEQNWQIRKESALALGKIKDKRAKKSLVTSFQTDVEYQVKWAAISALSKINDDEETKKLVNTLTQDLANIIQTEKDETLLSAAAKTLGEIGNIAAAKLMFKTMKISKELVRLEINLALGKMAKRFNYPTKDEFMNLLKHENKNL
ncbi:MAG: HEAT repeat domain-containing protein [Asgard group archaeon]|nr:HEAT repeat domain-containing protein [Asgard group archaeon]